MTIPKLQKEMVSKLEMEYWRMKQQKIGTLVDQDFISCSLVPGFELDQCILILKSYTEWIHTTVYIQYIALVSKPHIRHALKVSVFKGWQQFMSYLHVKWLFTISHYLKKDSGSSDV